MTTKVTRNFLLWCTIINYGVLLVWFMVFVFAHDGIHRNPRDASGARDQFETLTRRNERQRMIESQADPETQARVDELARKCNEGDLTPSERSEYERYVTVGNLVAILQAKARLVLAKRS